MTILITLSNRKFFSHQYSDVSNVSIGNQDIIVDKMIENELTPSSQIVKRQEKENLDKNHLANIKIENTYIKSGFNTRTPPYASMIYNDSGLCWLIAIIENFKSNGKLLKYIFENVQNKAFLKGLRNVLKIN